MEKRTLTPTFITSLKAAPQGQRLYFYDAVVPKLGVALTDTFLHSLRAVSSELETRAPRHRGTRLSSSWLPPATRRANGWRFWRRASILERRYANARPRSCAKGAPRSRPWSKISFAKSFRAKRSSDSFAET